MSEPIRIGVIGLGWVGRHRHIPTLQSEAHFKLVGVADRRGERAYEVAKAMPSLRPGQGERLAGICWIDDVEAVSIATAPMAHHDLACEALDRGLHVITEKPFAMNVTEGAAMVKTASDTSRQLGVVHNFQFARSMKQLNADIASGRIGKLRGVRALQLGNPSRRLPEWFESLPLGLFYDESPHLLYLLETVVGRLELAKAVCVNSRANKSTPNQIDAWFRSDEVDCPITLSCNFESSVSEWYLLVHGEEGVGIVDVFRDIYVRLRNDRTHSTADVIRTSLLATGQHWWQHVASGIPHVLGKLRYGNDEVFGRFARAVRGETNALQPISAAAALRTLSLQHDIINNLEVV